jgi:hypothetical protein
MGPASCRNAAAGTIEFVMDLYKRTRDETRRPGNMEVTLSRDIANARYSAAMDQRRGVRYRRSADTEE